MSPVVSGGRTGDGAGNRRRDRCEFRDARSVDGNAPNALCGAGERNPAFELAALLSGGKTLAELGLQDSQLLRQLEGDVEVAVVDRAQLDSK